MGDSNIASAMLKIERAGTGYSQGDGPTGRWSFLKSKTARPLALVPNKNADCSSAAGAATVMAGHNVDLSGTFYTGNQRAKMVAAGAQDLPFNYNSVQVGDVLWRAGHTEVVTSVNPKQQTGSRLDENGRISGGKPGDQTGREFATSALSKNWTRILRFKPKQAAPTPAKSVATLAAEVIAGKHGTGDQRKKSLGANYAAVQAEVNRQLAAKKPATPAKSVATLAAEVLAGKHGTGDARKKALGAQYAAVQAEVNRQVAAAAKKPVAAKKTNAQIAAEVWAGKWGSGAARTAALKKAGYDPVAIQKLVNKGVGR